MEHNTHTHTRTHSQLTVEMQIRIRSLNSTSLFCRSDERCSPSLPPLVLLLRPPVTDGAVCVTVRVAVAGCRSVGGRGEAVAGLCLRDCKNEYTLIRIARLMTFYGSLTKRGDGEPGGAGFLHLGHVGVVEELAEEHKVAGVHQ